MAGCAFILYLARGERSVQGGGLAATSVGEEVTVISVPCRRQGGAGREMKRAKCGQCWQTPAVRRVFVPEATLFSCLVLVALEFAADPFLTLACRTELSNKCKHVRASEAWGRSAQTWSFKTLIVGGFPVNKIINP